METADVVRLYLRGVCEIIVMTAVLIRNLQYVQVIARIENYFQDVLVRPLHQRSGCRIPTSVQGFQRVNRIQQSLAEFLFGQYLVVFVWKHGKISTLPAGHDSRGAGQVRQVTLGVVVLGAGSFGRTTDVAGFEPLGLVEDQRQCLAGNRARERPDTSVCAR